MPFPDAGLEVHSHQRLGEQIVAGPVAAVMIRCWRFDREIHEAELFVHGDLGPHAHISVRRPRVVFPRLAPVFSGTRNRVEPPDLLARPHVERAHEPLRVVVRRYRRAFSERRADDDDIADDGRRGVHANFSSLEIDLRADAFHDAHFQIEDAAVGERCDERAVFRIQLDETITGRHVDDAIVSSSVGPVRHAAPRQLPRRHGRALALAQAMCPVHFACRGIE